MHRYPLTRAIALATGIAALTAAGVAGASSPPDDSAPPMSPGSAPADSIAGGLPSDCAAIPMAPAAPAPAPGSSTPGTGSAMTDSAPTAGSSPTSGSATATADTTDQTMPGESAPGEGSAAPMEQPFVQVAHSDEYGDILVDHDCRALYVFDQDTDGTPTCTQACAESWPALGVTSASVPAVADELDPALFSIVEHSESGPMLAVDGHPLYYYAGDLSPTDLLGQGVGGLWWLVSPDGTPLAETSADSGPAAGGSSPMAPTGSSGKEDATVPTGTY